MNFNRMIAGALLSLTLVAPVVALADTVDLNADLLASSEVPSNTSKGSGKLAATFDTSSKVLKWTVTYADLTGLASMAHFHGPAAEGQNAGVVIPIDKSKLPSPIEGQATLTAAQADDLLAGKWYFNVHTAQNAGGEIRGQVLKQK